MVGVCLCLLAGELGACSHKEAVSPRDTVTLTTGLPGAGFFPMGQALAAAYTRSMPELRFVTLTSPGSVANVEALQAGTADLGFSFADVAYIASTAGLAGESGPLNHLRGIAVLELTPLHVVVRAGVGVRRLEDLRGHRVGLGPTGSGTALTAGLVLQAFGIGHETIRESFLPFNEASDRLRAGTLDAMFLNANFPSEAVRAATSAGAQLLPVQGAAVDRLRHNYPFLRVTKIPAHMYPGQRQPIHTVGVDTVLLCRSDLPARLVYALTREFFRVLPELALSQESLRLMDIEEAPATPVPLHEGAARYYRARELVR